MNKQKYEKLTRKILDHLDQGVVAWQQPWARTPLEAPMNAESGYRYTGANAVWMSLWTLLYGFSHPLYLTMGQIKKLNAAQEGRLIHVKKGEGGYPVFWFKEIEIDDPDGEVDENGDPVQVKLPIARVYYVWNVAQIAGLEPADLREYERRSQLEPHLLEFTPIASADAFVTQWQAIVPIEHDGERAFYQPARDFIRLPSPSRFKDVPQYYMTLFHEVIHSTGHSSRLDRDLTGDRMAESHGREELVAEMGSVYLASLFGIEPAFENSAAYIAGWKQACADDPQLLFWAAKRAQDATDYILNAVEMSLAVDTEAA